MAVPVVAVAAVKSPSDRTATQQAQTSLAALWAVVMEARLPLRQKTMVDPQQPCGVVEAVETVQTQEVVETAEPLIGVVAVVVVKTPQYQQTEPQERVILAAMAVRRV